MVVPSGEAPGRPDPGGGRCRCRREHRRDVVARLGDDADQRPDGRFLAGGHEDLAEHPGAERLHLDVGLVGFDLGEDIAALDPVALLLEPLDDLPGLHRVGVFRHDDLGDGHRQLPFALQTRRIAAAILSFVGVLSFSRFRAYGIGALAPVTRSTGASRSSNACSVTNAEISEPMPAKPAPASTMTTRWVLRTEVMIVSVSMGRSVRGSTSSTEMPSFSSSSAASTARYLMPM